MSMSQTNTVTRSSTASVADPARLALMWFGIQAVWGAVLGISLQARSVELAGTGSLAVYGEISFAGALAAAIVQLLAGPYSDARRRLGHRRIGFYLTGAIAAAIAVVAFYVAPSVPLLLISFVALQSAMNVAIGPYQAIVPDFVESPRIGTASGWMAGMQSGGNAAGAILASAIANHVALGCTLAAVLICTCALTVSSIRRASLRPIVAAAPLAFTRTLVDLFISRAFVYLGFYTLLGYFYFYVLHLLPKGFPVNATLASGICILLFTLVGTVGAAIASRPADRMDERLVVNVGGGLMVLGVAFLAGLHTLGFVPIFIGIAGVGWGIFLCADWAFACRLLPPSALATMMAIWNLAVVGPQMLAPLIATIALRWLGMISSPLGPRIALVLACIEIGIGLAWIWRLSSSQAGK
jgi:MFS family permease